MTEESSADGDGAEHDGEEERVGDDELAPARSEAEPDVEAAKEELEAVGVADEAEDGDAPVGDGETAAGEEQSPAEDERTSSDEPADGAVADDGTEDETGADDEANPEDLVRDPDQPQVTSSLEEAAEAASETTDADTATEADAPNAAAGDDAETAESESDGADAEPAQGATEPDGSAEEPDADPDHQPGVPDDVRKYDRFKKVDGSQYDRVNEFLRDRTYITAREWAIARLCSDFRTETGVEMTKIGENLPELVPFMTDTYTPQAVNQARSSFEDKVRTAGATFLYGAMCDFFTAEELDDVMYEATEVAKFLLEVEGVELSVEDELEAEDRISAVMRDVRSSSAELRHERCPECGAELSGGE